MKRRPENFVRSIDHFRGIAVLFIVAGHSLPIAGLPIDTFAKQVLANLVLGGTILFMFISGYLFHHRFQGGFRYGQFLLSKFKNVVSPYLILSIVPIGWAILHADPMSGGMFLPKGEGFYQEYLRPVLLYLATGRVLITYWFIPFSVLVYLMAPLHRKFLTQSGKVQAGWIVLASVLALYVQRPLENIDPLQSLAYFMPSYLIGMVASQQREWILGKFRGREFWILLPVVGLAILEAWQRNGYGNYHKPAFDFGLIDLMFFQKTALCFFFMVFLDRFESVHSRVVGFFAETSFALFFIHPYVLWICEIHGVRYADAHASLVYPLVVGAIIGASMVPILLVKFAMGKRSRYVVGW
ncbi:MAG: acyltransferase [Fibrobacteria bacterium]|nr:acyltransferase [Fibrobacteria bacterium]